MKRISSFFLFSMFAILLFLGSVNSVKALGPRIQITTFIGDDDRGDEVKLTEAEKYAEKMPEKRSAGKGVAPKESMARQLARLDARANFAEAISSAIISASKETQCDLSEYAGDDEDGSNVEDAADRTNTFKQSITQEVVNNTVEVKKNTFYNKRTRKYTVYVCLEYNGDVSSMIEQTVKKVRQRVSDKDRLRIDANLNAFEKEIEEKLKSQTLKNTDNE